MGIETSNQAVNSAADRKEPLTPLMQQYHALKARCPQDLLFFRLGDFYELFHDDAVRAAPLLEVVLTHRQNVPMCGVPAHAIDTYISKILKSGLRVAIADQMEEASAGKGIVRREIVRVVTPGTLQEDALLSATRSNYLAAVSFGDERAGLAVLECSTGEFRTTEFACVRDGRSLWDELIRLSPSEVVLPMSPQSGEWKARLQKQGISVNELPAVDFSGGAAEDRLKQAFGTASIRGFGLEGKPLALSAAGGALRYAQTTQCGRNLSLQALQTYSLDDRLLMDAHTLEHLDLIDQGDRKKTLIQVLDQTLTPMGGRLLRSWLLAPLKSVPAIHERQQNVEFFLESKEARRPLRAILQGLPDFQRILSRLVNRGASPRDLAGLSIGLRRIEKVQHQLRQAHTTATALGAPLPPTLERLLLHFPGDPEMADLLESAIVDTPPATLKEGGVIRPGYDSQLEEIRSWVHDGKEKILDIEKREKAATGIATLKVGFNNVYGYFLEVTKSHLSRVPETYIRKQTTAGGERYITPELKEYETKILGAEDRALRLETALVAKLTERILEKAAFLRTLAEAVGELDVYISLAEVADRHHYVRPTVDSSTRLSIREGRHPILDELLPSGTLVANDTDLDGRSKQIVILTGPNMSGKSTYLRQTALIVIMAQMGSFVPAAEAHIGIIDRVFTRIGASDRLADGESTFMVEMVETAQILHHATAQSLVILDEVGRGTSTYDGMSIAWACLEYLNGGVATTDADGQPGQPRKVGLGPKVLFATHYFELTQLASKLSGVRNAHVAAREWGDDVVFLHKVEDGPADRAYGIHVARLAGVPGPVVQRAQVLLTLLEQKAYNSRPPSASTQGLLFEPPAPANRAPAKNEPALMALRTALAALDLNRLTPLEALQTLDAWKQKYLRDADEKQ